MSGFEFGMETDEQPEELGAGGGLLPAGIYHVMVNEVAPSQKGNGWTFDLKILAGTVAGQEERTQKFFLYYDPENPQKFAVDRVKKILWAAGLIEPGAPAREYDIESELVGCDFVVGFRESSYEKDGKTRESREVDWNDGWPLPTQHENCSEIPRRELRAKSDIGEDIAAIGPEAGGAQSVESALEGLA